ncbi:MAG TPA: phosphoadenylyl-sulfate reductase, partial [Acidimicrobiales bacterium]|nr:phosphoadenylyl-sulfate reductase [Acidimicrobiales bacterium]
MIEAGTVDEHELAAVSARLESLPIRQAAEGAIAWVVENFGDAYAVASSFQDAVLIDLVITADPDAEIIFLDTDFHFPETLAFVERLRKTWKLNLTTTHPAIGREESPCGSPGCCQLRKVEPLNAALKGKAAWVTGLKRVDTPEREAAPIIAWDPQRNMVKVNPVATWSDEDIDEYLAEHRLPRHPLTYVGYVS